MNEPHAALDRVQRRGLRTLWAVLLAAVAANLVCAIHLWGAESALVSEVSYSTALLGAGFVCLARAAAVSAERLVWTLLGAGLTSYALGDLVWWVAFRDAAPFPSASDALWLLFYPASYATVILLVVRNTEHAVRRLWVDALIGVLGMGALGAALILGPALAAASGTTAAVAVNLAYPLGDLLLLCIVVWACALHNWRPSRRFVLLGCGFALGAAADGWYLHELAAGTYVEHTVLDTLWPTSKLLIAWAAWQPVGGSKVQMAGPRMIAVPIGFALVAIGLVLYDHFAPLNLVALSLAAAVLLAVLARLWLTFGDHHAALTTSRHEAMSDSLTGLANRRRLTADLDLAMAREHEPSVLAIFDLDGFKAYNDTFGHPAGDALLARVGGRLRDAIGTRGRAYRMGGDEFCVLLRGPRAENGVRLAAAAEALTESGEGFHVSCSYGAIEVPTGASTASEALRVADRELYASKASRVDSAGQQAQAVLLRALGERHSDLADHQSSVASLATCVGERLGLDWEALDHVARAAELHDIGKVAIPESILSKPGPLDAEEWAFMRRHTLIGEAILSEAPALLPVARIVRSTHERWDGGGYPDALAGLDIPIGARIVLACDAYDAMISTRSYSPAASRRAACAELERSAGSQLDPQVVEALLSVLASMAAPRPPTATLSSAVLVATPA